MGVGGISEERIRHLELLQGAINRFGTNSFLLKGWALTVAGAVDAYSARNLNAGVSVVGVLSPLAFWFLDAYFLLQERLFRRLYDDVRKVDSTVEPFSMSVTVYATRGDWWRTATSVTLLGFYGSLLLAGLVLTLLSLV
jgi:hypothetical protein